MIDVIYLNGGIGVRADLGFPKQFARIKGKPIIVYALETLNQIKEINKIYIPTAAAAIQETVKILQEYRIKNFEICPGGSNRQESVYKTLEKIITSEVFIMESVRPFVPKDLILEMLKLTENAIIPRNKTKSTLISSNLLMSKKSIFNRNNIGEVQTPQKYNTDRLKNAYDDAIRKKKDLSKYTDDAHLLADNFGLGMFWNVFIGPEENIKITTKLDLKIAEVIYEHING